MKSRKRSSALTTAPEMTCKVSRMSQRSAHKKEVAA